MAAELGHARLEGVARACRFLEEEHVERLGVENVVVKLPKGKAPFELIGDVQRRLQLVAGPVFGGDEIFAK